MGWSDPSLTVCCQKERRGRAAANDFNVLREDTYGLIRALGRDCAGALVIQPAEALAPPVPTALTAAPLSDSEIGRLVANLPYAPLGVGGRVRISLAGVQEKLLLTRMPNRSWGRPVDGTPSTHILKPEIARFPNTVENEAFCMRLARNLDLPVASIETMTLDGRRIIVVERYDRTLHANGSVERIHQEDFCQATGVLPCKKYEEMAGRRCAGSPKSSKRPPVPILWSYCCGPSPSTSSLATETPTGRTCRSCMTPRVGSGLRPCTTSSRRWSIATTA